MIPAEIAERARRDRDAIEAMPLPPSVAAVFDAAVERHGDRPLWIDVDGGGPTLDYRAFAGQVARAAQVLVARGIGEGSHVGLMLPSVPAMAVAWMALARLGAVMVPINTHYTARELEEIVTGGAIELLIADHDHAALLAEQSALPHAAIIVHGGRDAGFGGSWEALLADADDRMPPRVPDDPDRLMSLQFTSGSTGLPKGCMLPHRYWTQIGLVRSRQGPPVERMLIDMPFHYMGGQWRFMMALYLGAAACVARKPSLSRMIERLAEHRIDFCSVSPLMVKQPVDPAAARLSLKWAGTMAMAGDLHADLEQRLGGAPVREMYGLTETGATLAMPAYADAMVGSGACGLPQAFRECRIVDADGRDLPPGETGELWIAGPGMMTGYYNRPDATAAAWSGRWFRSGDLFRRDAHGFHTIVGRIKDVIRRSGENVSATEVENVVATMPDVVEAAAIGVADPDRGEEVKLLVVARPGSDPQPDAIRAYCGERLAPFKLPRFVSFVETLPKTSSGKVAKHVLRADHGDRAGSYDAVERRWL